MQNSKLRQLFLTATLTACAFAFAQSSSAQKDACSLLTSADAQAALGEPVGPSQMTGDACRFRSTQGSALKGKTISVSVHSSTTDIRGTMPGMMDNLKSNGYPNVQKVAGVGDEAIWASRTSLGRLSGELTVRKGQHTLLIIIINGMADDALSLDRAKALAIKVFPRV
jgi:hypothetical protein